MTLTDKVPSRRTDTAYEGGAERMGLQRKLKFHTIRTLSRKCSSYMEGYTLSREICGKRIIRHNPCRKVRLDRQKSAWGTAHEKTVNTDGGKESAAAGNTARWELGHGESSWISARG